MARRTMKFFSQGLKFGEPSFKDRIIESSGLFWPMSKSFKSTVKAA